MLQVSFEYFKILRCDENQGVPNLIFFLDDVWVKGTFIEKTMYKMNDSSEHAEARQPVDYFFDYLPIELWKRAVKYTNEYMKKRMLNVALVSLKELLIYLALNMATGMFRLPQLSMYWSNDCGMPMFKNNMSYRRFYQIRTALHFISTSKVDTRKDRIKKIRPLFDWLLKKCHQIPRPSNVCMYRRADGTI